MPDGDRASTSPTMSLEKLIEKLSSDYPDLRLISSDHFRWSPENKSIHINKDSETAVLSLLHEISHMLCGHNHYKSDIGLLRMEVEAWERAKDIGADYGLPIDEDHIEKCLDSYREWIYRRSSCPLCTQAGVERKTGLYVCINCQKKWRVTSARFCRVYRKTVT